jgi:lipoyl(octanoyl) transferase
MTITAVQREKLQDRITLRQLGLQPYEPVSRAMHIFTDLRTPETQDEIWLVEHPKVFTQGQAGKAEHVLFPGDIPVIQSDRGGQVTYHGPGQQVMYVMVDIKRRKMGVRELVTAIEQTVVDTLAFFDIEAYPRAEENLLAGTAHPPWLFAARAGAEYRYGFRTFSAHQSLRLCRSGDDPGESSQAGYHR